MSVIQQRSFAEFGPAPVFTPVQVIDTPAEVVNLSNSGVNYTRSSTASFHYDYAVTGDNLEDASVSYSSSPLEEVGYPLALLKRHPELGVGYCQVKIANARGETRKHQLDFVQRNADHTYSQPLSVEPGTYAEYSWNRVAALFSALDDGTPENHRVFDASQLRRATGVIPHAALTCHAAGAGGSITAAGGHLRTIAITRRHCLQIGHSGSGGVTGWQIRFRGVDNSIVTKTVIANINVLYDWGITLPPEYAGPQDVRLYVLDSDLPASITPAPYVGDWFFNYSSSNKVAGTYAPGAFGFISFNQDTHICPVQATSPEPIAYNTPAQLTISDQFLQGIDFGMGYTNHVSLPGFTHWSYYDKTGAVLGTWYPDRPFFHFVRAGDSGSPIFWPVGDNKWAIGFGIVSGSMWRPEAINALIAHANSALGITETYEVEVAPNPLA